MRFDRPHPSTRFLRVLTACLALALIGSFIAPAAEAQSPLPAFSKAFSPSTIGPGSVSTLTFTISNSTSLPVRNLAFTDDLPAGMTIASPAAASTTCPGAALDAPVGGSTITFTDGGVGGGTSCTVRVNVTSSTPGTHTNTSSDLTSDAGNSGPAIADLTVATDRPGFSKSFSPSTVGFQGRSRLTFTVDNSANAAEAIFLSFTDNLPANMVVATPANRVNGCGGALSAPTGGGTISLTSNFGSNATVAAGGTCTIALDVLGNAIGQLGNVSGELSSQPGPFGGTLRSSGKASAVLNVTSDQLALTKEFTDDPVPPGGTVTLRLTVFNLNRDFPATDLAFTDDLDAALSGLVATGTPIADPCGSGSSLTGTSTLSLTGGNLPAEGSCTFDVSLFVPATVAQGVYVNTTSQVTGTVDGRPADGAAASDDLFVQAVPILTKEFVDDPVGGGGSVELEFTITNTSPDQTATDIGFSDVFVPELPTASSVPANGFCGAGSTATFVPLFNPSGGGSTTPASLTVSGAELAPGASCTFSIFLDVVVGAGSGPYANLTSEVTATVGGESVAGAPASDDLIVVAAPELAKEFIDDPVAPGDTVTLRFTLSHEETAAGDALDISFTDDLDAALSGLVATGLPQGDVCGSGSLLSGTMTLLLTGGSLMPGETCTFDVTLQVPSTAPAGAHTNTTSSVSAMVLGVATTENGATDDLDIAGLVLTKEFIDDPTLPGGTATLRFTIENQSPVSGATDIQFTDNLAAAVANMTASGLPQNDVCGTGSLLTTVSSDRTIVFQSGTLAAGASCSFDVVTNVPASTVPDTYTNVTSGFSAVIDGALVFFDNAIDELTVASDFLTLEKEFVDDPVGPGDTVVLRFTVSNLSASQEITDIAFTDDLDAALSGLASISGTVAGACGGGSEASGTGTVALTGGNLAAGASCSFDVTLQVPAAVPLGTEALNVTSEATGLLGGLSVTGAPASDTLRIDFVDFAKAFSGPAFAGDTVSLSFTVTNLSASDVLVGLAFSDDLSAVLPGLVAVGLPEFDVCGEGSELLGASFLTLSGGNLLPGGSCTFSVDVQVPAGADAGTYPNVTSDLTQDGAPVAAPATADLEVIEPADDDDDGVLNADDFCPGTEIPEGVPTHGLKPNRYALVDADFDFDTLTPPGGGPGDEFNTTDTGGCSCEQIIDELGLGNGHRKFGCSIGAMRNWVAIIAGGGPGKIYVPRTRK